ncbi:AraC family transcriptional regulator [Spartinivicinus ruber]|uniref:AraC family transcriptional regulator n=1 Tax=Spartinivicinus ruber TaxID=2683272 RepID=UPI0013D7B7DD|nr:helix-turn-helix domain-containing protein [Spartinivicinus ruber]
MKINYQQKLTPLIRYLESHFNEPLNLTKVAKIACLSPYHFHRIFKAVMGETLSEYIRRLRLQAAADDLFKKQSTVTEVALNYGFSSSQSFAKAFRQHFGLTPTETRNCESLEAFAALFRNSKIGHVLSKTGNADDAGNPYATPETKNRSIVTMHTQQFDTSKLAYIRVTGPYGENYEPAATKLYQWAGAKGLTGSQCIFIYHDNPEITPAEKCRTDICLMVPTETEVSGGVELQDFPGGSYGVIRKTITDKSQYGPSWDDLMKELIQSGLESDDRPCFELYHSYDPQTHIADVSFCTAIKS